MALEVRLGSASGLPDITRNNPIIVGLRKTIVERIDKKSVFIGLDSEEPLELSLTELLDPEGFLPMWVLSTIQALRPVALQTGGVPSIGFTAYMEKSDKSILDYKVQAFRAASPLLVINPLLSTLSRCIAPEHNDDIFMDRMICDSFDWFNNHGFPQEEYSRLVTYFSGMSES